MILLFRSSIAFGECPELTDLPGGDAGLTRYESGGVDWISTVLALTIISKNISMVTGT